MPIQKHLRLELPEERARYDRCSRQEPGRSAQGTLPTLGKAFTYLIDTSQNVLQCVGSHLSFFTMAAVFDGSSLIDPTKPGKFPIILGETLSRTSLSNGRQHASIQCPLLLSHCPFVFQDVANRDSQLQAKPPTVAKSNHYTRQTFLRHKS